VFVHVPPSGWHVDPDGTHVPFWQTPPAQQSESEVHGPVLSGTHVAAQLKPVFEFGSGKQMWLQQLSHKLHA
jgi:hypothetical protein